MSKKGKKSEEKYRGYRETSLEWLKTHNLQTWDTVEITVGNTTLEGIILPRIELASANHITLKLKTGYNIGVNVSDIAAVKKLGHIEAKYEIPKVKVPKTEKLPYIPVLGCGGTIAARLDYRTGGTIPAITPEELFSLFPEVAEIAHVKPRLLFELFSESIRFEHYKKVLEEVEKEINENGAKGVVITHGTDTMSYTAAALSFGIENLNVPVVLTGAQRSSDRPSSDAFRNFYDSVLVAAHSNIAEVMVVMHETSSDLRSAVHRGTRVRKMHTSRRDAFQSISIPPLAFVTEKKEIKYTGIPYKAIKKSNKSQKISINPQFEEKTALIYFHPNFNPEVIDFYVDRGYRGLVIAGTGLGHVGTYVFKSLQRALEEDIVVVMTSQCLYGLLGMTVYENGRDLLKLGVLSSHSMLPEVAFIKLAHALGRFNALDDVKSYMKRNIAGEMIDREVLLPDRWS